MEHFLTREIPLVDYQLSTIDQPSPLGYGRQARYALNGVVECRLSNVDCHTSVVHALVDN